VSGVVHRSAFALLERQSGFVVVPLTVALVGLVGLVDFWAGPEISFAIFYLVPISLAAWWGGFSWGALFSLSGAVVWHLIDVLETAPTHPVVRLWNGVVRFGFFIITSSLLARLRAAMLREQSLARTDPLTGVANGRTFYEEAFLEIQRARRNFRPFTLVYLDLDNFKAVNDRLGHSAGDELLRQVARAIRKNTRLTDLVARLGGDEFAVLLPETDAPGAAASVAKLRETVGREMADKGWPVTCSIGAATFLKVPPDVDVMVRCVDAFMYRVKREGKNCSRHEVVRDLEELPGWDRSKVERRASVRIVCNLSARLRRTDRPLEDYEIVTIRDISTTGISIRMDCELPERSVVVIELLSRIRAKTLLARVVNRRAHANGWIHGCQIANQLSQEELKDWLDQGPVPQPAEKAPAPEPDGLAKTR
jgi:diguanylate cyclase (GGDEF)-like protein